MDTNKEVLKISEWKNREIAFQKWAAKTVKTEGSIDKYIKNSLNKAIPQKLIELKEKENSFKSIFQVTDIHWLSNLNTRLRKGDLVQFNHDTAKQQPSAAVKKYIEFLESEEYLINKTKDNTSGKQPLNQILYGPPGTGKTYNTINKAIEIIEDRILNDEELNDREKLKEKFEKYKTNGQIEFVTFHQSYGYEEFVEGIKAIPIGQEGNEDGEEMIYDVLKGILRKISQKANDDNIKFVGQSELDLIYENYIKNLSYENNLKEKSEMNKVLKTKTGKSFNLIRNANSIVVKANTTSIPVSSDLIKRTIAEGEAPYYKSYVSVIINDMIGNKKININNNKVIKNYILIIDEINRGNISKIFGELITLIEPSKRIGADEEIKVKLPYSGDIFGVPLNLYILGTMNTADRSIALMDTALRRRFDFTEMMPNLEVLEEIEDIDSINIKTLLKKINERIEYLYDRDHTIGHAYFMSLKDEKVIAKRVELDNIFRNKVIPLLQEYFYDDWEKIKMVLGSGFILKEKVEPKTIFNQEDIKDSDYIEEEKYQYSIKEEFDYSSFKSE